MKERIEMTINIRKIGFALGFATVGAIGSVGMQAIAKPPSDGPEAQQRGPGMQQGQGGPFFRLMDKIDLTESQQTELEAIQQSHIEERKSTRAGRAKGEMLQMLANQDLDRQSVHSMIDEQLATQAELMHAHTDDYLDFMDALDPEQKDELADTANQILEHQSERGGPEQQEGSENRHPRRSR
jgi:Spy/CpxP family protein refolding chaperone